VPEPFEPRDQFLVEHRYFTIESEGRWLELRERLDQVRKSATYSGLERRTFGREPLKVRRKALERLVKGQNLILPARRLLSNGMAAWAEVLHRGIEGYVAKDPESPYVGGRTLKWLKVKQAKYREGERGWEPKGKS
jgi:hypothetical protein